jgi:uncharacterized membrane protein YwzB
MKREKKIFEKKNQNQTKNNLCAVFISFIVYIFTFFFVDYFYYSHEKILYI